MEMTDRRAGEPRICLVMIFNHRYDGNIGKLREIYGKRFHKIRFLVPFYDGNEQDVIPVYECSYQFPGYLIQAYEKLVTDSRVDYYFFVSDDLLLAPGVNEDNLLEVLGMLDKSVFIPSIFPLNSDGLFGWPHARFSSMPFLKERTQWKGSIPDYRSALGKFNDFFHKPYPEKYSDTFFESSPDAGNSQMRTEIDNFVDRNGGCLDIPYPMAYGYSDIFMIKADMLFPIARLCGVFSAMNMFAEIALPTAIVLASSRDQVVTLAETGYQCRIDWAVGRTVLEEEYRYDIGELYENWDARNLFIHPVKLSKWKVPDKEETDL